MNPADPRPAPQPTAPAPLPLEALYGPCSCGKMVRESEVNSIHHRVGIPGHYLSMAVAVEKVPILDRRHRNRRAGESAPPTSPEPRESAITAAVLDNNVLLRESLAAVIDLWDEGKPDPDDVDRDVLDRARRLLGTVRATRLSGVQKP